MPVTHAAVSTLPDTTDPTLIQPSEWNAAHVVDLGWIDIRDMAGATTDDKLDAAAAALGSNPGEIFFPPGTWTLTRAHVFAHHGIVIRGAGQRLTVIRFNPTATGVAFTFDLGTGSAIAQCAVRGLTFDATGDTTHVKTALKVVDGEEIEISDVAISNWTKASTKDCIGLHIQGRQTFTCRRLTFNCDQPVFIDGNPNSVVDCDHFHFQDCYYIADSSQPHMKIADGVNLFNLTIDGYQAWALGSHGLYWVDTTSTTTALAVVIKNVRWEQGAGGAGYALYLSPRNPILNVHIENCYCGTTTTVKGYYLRNIRGGLFAGNAYAGTIEALNIDGSVTGMDFVGNNLTSVGGTITATGWSAGAWIGNEQNGRIGIGVVTPTGDVVLRNLRDLAALNAAGAEIVFLHLNAVGQWIIAPAGAFGYYGGKLYVGGAGAAPPFSHQVVVPNQTSFGGGTVSALNSIAIAQIDGSDKVKVDPGAVGATTGASWGVQGAFGCNAQTPQTPHASGGALAAYGAGVNGFDTGGNASALHALVVAMRAALVANGIMS